MNTQLSPAEHADRLNKCLEAGLTVLFDYIVRPTGWTVWPNKYSIPKRDLEHFDFLVLSPGETIDNFTLPSSDAP